MHNPPHPDPTLREYLGDPAVTTAAAHLQALAHAQRQGRNLRRHGHPAGGRPGHHASRASMSDLRFPYCARQNY
jgi:hypothetical protein